MKPSRSTRLVYPSLLGLASLCAALLLGLSAKAAAPTVVGLWRFDDGSGTTATDSSGLGNDGTLQGDSGVLPTWVPSMPGFGSALLFTNDLLDHSYVSVPGSANLMLGQYSSNAWSMTVWAYENSEGTGTYYSTYGRMITIDDGFAFQLESGASGDAQLYTWSANNPAWQMGWGTASTVIPPLDQWEHWAVVYDGTNISIYLNGNQANGGFASAAVTAALGFVGYQGSLTIGSELDQNPDVTWNGMLDDVAVFSGALTQDQVQTVMSGNFSSFMGAAPVIVSQPQNQLVPQGSAATMTVGAAGAATLTYQWYQNGTSLGAAGNSATLSLPSLTPSQAGTYWVVVKNSQGTAMSQPVTLSVGSLVGLWRFDEGSGTNVLDASGNGNNGTLQGDNGNVPTWESSQTGFGSALSFTNDNTDYSYVSIPGSPLLEIGQTAGNPWTITAWAYERSGGEDNFIATYGRILTIDNGYDLQIESGATNDAQMYTWDRNSGAWQIGWGSDDSVSPLLDQWVHWAVVYDGSTISLYRDGNMGVNGGLASQPVSKYLEYGSLDDGSILIGTELAQPANRNWNGLLDDIAVFNTALTSNQVQAVMAGNFNGFVAPPPLSISVTGANTLVSWPVSAQTFKLQSSASVPATSWTPVATAAVSNGKMLTVTLPRTGTAQYFRLVGP